MNWETIFNESVGLGMDGCFEDFGSFGVFDSFDLFILLWDEMGKEIVIVPCPVYLFE